MIALHLIGYNFSHQIHIVCVHDNSARAAWDAQQTAENAGELLLAAADAMRLAGVDAEEALTFAAKRFTQRLEADET